MVVGDGGRSVVVDAPGVLDSEWTVVNEGKGGKVNGGRVVADETTPE